MAWNEPGNGKKDPWNSGGGDQPPDLDEVFRKLQQKLGGLFGGGGKPSSGGGSGTAGFAALALLLGAVWLIYDSIYIIKEAERGVVLRFGKYHHTMLPGPNFAFPRPIDQIYKVDVAQIRSVSNQGQMLTKDENIVNLDFAIQYKVKDAQNFLFKVRRPQVTLSQAAEAALRAVVGDNEMDFLLIAGRAQIASDTRTTLQQILDRYETGLEVTAVNLQDVRPPQQVKEAFDDAIKAREDKERFENEAEAYANKEIPIARGDAARIQQESEAYREAKVARAEGESRRFELLLEEYQKAPEVTRQRLYLETMENVLQATPKVVLDVEQGNNIMYLPLDQIMQRTTTAGQRRLESSPDGAFVDAQANDNLRGREAVRRGREGR